MSLGTFQGQKLYTKKQIAGIFKSKFFGTSHKACKSNIGSVQGLEEVKQTKTIQQPTTITLPQEIKDFEQEFAQYHSLKKRQKLKVAVLLSGGVDSSVALSLLQSWGYDCHAFYLKIWFEESFENSWSQCPWDDDIKYASQVCQQLGVNLEVVPLSGEYWKYVVKSTIRELQQGLTPNPDIWCNSRIKFGAFLDHLTLNCRDFDYVSSGHYAKSLRYSKCCEADQLSLNKFYKRLQSSEQSSINYTNLDQKQTKIQTLIDIEKANDNSNNHIQCIQNIQNNLNKQNVQQTQEDDRNQSSSDQYLNIQFYNDRVILALAPDQVKDQTYFLAQLSRQQLDRCLFPLGQLSKSQVREIADQLNLANKHRPDSQGICFLGKVRFQEFVKQHLGVWTGPFIDSESGQIVGFHEGFYLYTYGQRSGICLPQGPWYVVDKDPQKNVVRISRNYYANKQLRRNETSCFDIKFIDDRLYQSDLLSSGELFCKTRHGPDTHQCIVKIDRANNIYNVQLLGDDDQGLSPGQHIVFYFEGLCIGQAVMSGATQNQIKIQI